VAEQDFSKRGIAVVEYATGERVHFVEVKAGRSLDKVERGMLINMDRDRFYTVQCDGDK
jgi:hypothetical protein